MPKEQKKRLWMQTSNSFDRRLRLRPASFFCSSAWLPFLLYGYYSSSSKKAHSHCTTKSVNVLWELDLVCSFVEEQNYFCFIFVYVYISAKTAFLHHRKLSWIFSKMFQKSQMFIRLFLLWSQNVLWEWALVCSSAPQQNYFSLLLLLKWCVKFIISKGGRRWPEAFRTPHKQ